MNGKLEKLEEHILKTEERIEVLQKKLKSLQKEKMELENLEMIEFLRKHKTNFGELQGLLERLHMDNGGLIPVELEVRRNEGV